jgi:hypothetical protein
MLREYPLWIYLGSDLGPRAGEAAQELSPERQPWFKVSLARAPTAGTEALALGATGILLSLSLSLSLSHTHTHTHTHESRHTLRKLSHSHFGS